MPIPSRVLSSGNSGLATTSICGNGATALVAVGTNQATALQLSAVMNAITTSSSSTGVLLPKCEEGAVVYIYNLSGQTIKIYTNETSGVTINAAVAGSTGVSLGDTRLGIAVGTSATTWAVHYATTAA